MLRTGPVVSIHQFRIASSATLTRSLDAPCRHASTFHTLREQCDLAKLRRAAAVDSKAFCSRIGRNCRSAFPVTCCGSTTKLVALHSPAPLATNSTTALSVSKRESMNTRLSGAIKATGKSSSRFCFARCVITNFLALARSAALSTHSSTVPLVIACTSGLLNFPAY
jgi:hypothetical protein